MGSKQRHQKYRLALAKAVWSQVRRLSRLPPKEKRQVVCGQILPILLWGSELHDKPSESMNRFAAELSRWVIGAWRGSNKQRVEEISGIMQPEELMRNKKIRWAGSVYARHLPDLRTYEGKRRRY